MSGWTDEVDKAIRYAVDQAAEASAQVDRDARFPSEAVAALREGNLLNAAAPVAMGGLGLTPAELVEISGRLARACGATAMVWAMHQIHLACMVRHHPESAMVQRSIDEQWLVSSVASEPGIGGDLRSSRAGVGDDDGGQHTLVKQASAVSYGAFSQGYLVTARADEGAVTGNQVSVLVSREQTKLEQTGTWNTLGMRGTCSPAFHLDMTFGHDQILPVPFRDIAARTMVPMSHLLWAAIWVGLATEAVDRAIRASRAKSRGPAVADNPNLGLAHVRLSGLKAQLTAATLAAEPVLAGDNEPTLALTVELNDLKIGVSEGAVDVVRLALGVCGLAGFGEAGPYSVARLMRDVLSGPVMIGNSRLVTANSQMLLMSGGER
jgi:acyl-CoA dehydrogenase